MYKLLFDNYDNIVLDDDFEKCVEDNSYESEVIEKEIRSLEEAKIVFENKETFLISEYPKNVEFRYYKPSILEIDNNVNNNMYQSQSIIQNAKAKIIMKYFSDENINVDRFIPNKNLIVFSCPVCNKNNNKCYVWINTFKICTHSKNDCTDTKHVAAYKKIAKEIKALWDDSHEKKINVFNLSKEYIDNIVEKYFPSIVRHINNMQLYKYDEAKKHYIELKENSTYNSIDDLIYSTMFNDNESYLTTKQTSDVRHILKNSFNFPKKEFEYELINCKNCVYDLKNNEKLDHDSKYFFNYILDVEYKENLETTELNILMDQWGIDKLDIKKMLGYCFQKETSLEKSFYLIGKPQSGKGTLLKMIKTIFNNRSLGITVGELYADFGCSEIKGKTLLIDDDFDNKCFLQNDVKKFNKIVSGESLTVNEKYKARETLDSSHKIIIAANDVPKFRSENDNGGFWRRMHVIKFKNQFLGKKGDSKIKHGFHNNENLKSQFLIYVLEGLKLYNQFDGVGEFFQNQQETEEIIKLSEPLLEYFDDHVEREINSKIKATTFYENYLHWCAENHIKNVNAKTFYKKITEFYGITDVNKPMKINNKTIRGIKGLSIIGLNQSKLKIV